MHHSVLTLVRVAAGAPRPTDETFREAVQNDRAEQSLPPALSADICVAGPYRIRVDGCDLDEYVVWEP